RAADVLVALTGVDPEVGRDLDRLVELRRAERLELADRVGKRDRVGRCLVAQGTVAFRLGCQVRAPFRRAAADPVWPIARSVAIGLTHRRAVAPGDSIRGWFWGTS